MVPGFLGGTSGGSLKSFKRQSKKIEKHRFKLLQQLCETYFIFIVIGDTLKYLKLVLYKIIDYYKMHTVPLFYIN